MSLEKKIEYLIFILIFVFLFGFSINQFYNQHWTSILDQDPIIIYNSLLISSGLDQEYRDHPGYTTFLILGGLFKFLSFFFESFRIEEIMSSEKIDQNFQKLFYISRLLNTFYIFICSLILFKILKELKVKFWISIFCSILFIIHLSTFELLYLIRSEIVSILFYLLSIYSFLKFIHCNNKIYLIIKGLYIAISLLAKIQVIILIITFLIIIPQIIKYLSYKTESFQLALENYNYNLAKVIISVFLLFFIFYQSFVGLIFLNETNNSFLFLNNNLDFYFFIFFFIFYRVYIYYLDKNEIVNTKIVIFCLSLVIVGFILGVIFVFLLDIFKIIPAHNSIFLRILNPLEFMNTYTVKSKLELVNIFVSIKDFFLIGLNNLSYDFNKYYEHKIFGIKSRLFFRTIYVSILLILIWISIRKIKNQSINNMSFFIFGGILVYYFILNIRETHGYNIYILCIYLILFSLILNQLSKNKSLLFSVILLSFFFIEHFSFSNIHKNSFKLEPRVYDICKNTDPDKWKNTTNYFNNRLFSSPIVMVDNINWWFETYLYNLHANSESFFFRYCDQVNSFNEKEINFYFRNKILIN